MRYLVNGVPAEVASADSVEVKWAGDRQVVKSENGLCTALSVRHGDKVLVSVGGRQFEVERDTGGRERSKSASDGTALAPMPGQIVDVFVEKGQQVELGQKLLVLEAMKMQHAVSAPFDGEIVELPARKGDQVFEGQLLVQVIKKDG